MKISEELIKRACDAISQEEVDGRGVCPDPSRFKGYVETAARVFEAAASADSKVDDGGPAFSGGLFEPQHGGSNDREPWNHGMSLRDWFAGQALAGDFAAQSAEVGEIVNNTTNTWMLERAQTLYRMADAMIAARKAGA